MSYEILHMVGKVGKRAFEAMGSIYYKFVETSLGRSLVAETVDENASSVCFISFPKAKTEEEYLTELLKLYPNAILSKSLYYEKDVKEVIEGKPAPETLKVSLDGTDFCVAVWNELARIPYGTVASYAEVAKALGKPANYCRAVAQACSRNHIAVLIPCHRVIASNGDISGFGWGVENKKMLLKREGYNKFC